MKNKGEMDTLYDRQLSIYANNSYKKYVNQIQKDCKDNCDIEKEAARIRKERAEKMLRETEKIKPTFEEEMKLKEDLDREFKLNPMYKQSIV